MKEHKYYALYKELRKRIRTGAWRAGEKLPSKRVLSDKTGNGLITVQKAYAMLEDEGYITAVERRGYFVRPLEGIFPENSHPAPHTLSLLPPESPDEKRDFADSVWFRTIRHVLAEQGDRLFTKSPGKGCAILRNAIASYLQRDRGMIAEPAQIIIGSGAEQLYETAVKVLGRDRIFGIEDPSYAKIRLVYAGMGVKICPLRLGTDGIETNELRAKAFDILHVTPFHSYPSGITTSAAKRYEYLRWAAATGGHIIEDDFDSEFFLPGPPIESLYMLDNRHSVVYLNTFSKSISPAIRIGYMILPEALLPVYDRQLGAFSCSVPVLDQYILAEFINSGSFERHLNHLRRKLKAEK